MSWSMEKANEVLAQINQRAAQDAAFRERVLQAPASVVEEVSGMRLPEGVQLEATHAGDGSVQVIARGAPDESVERELGEEELDQLAGGIKFSSFVIYRPSTDPVKKK